LLPGQTVLVSDLSQGSAGEEIYSATSLTADQTFLYALPPQGNKGGTAVSDSMDSWESQDLSGRKEVVYRFVYPYFEGPPPPPDIVPPVVLAIPLSGSDTVSIAGFGAGALDVGTTVDPLSPKYVSVGYIERSASGDVITFGGFTSGDPGGLGSSDLFTLVPSGELGLGVATASITDLDGNPRTMSIIAVGPVPEPGPIALLVAGLVGLCLRFRRRLRV
jgi:hypothetical protein